MNGMRHELGHTCLTRLALSGIRRLALAREGGRVTARISKLVTREHVVHAINLGNKAISSQGSSQPPARRPRLVGPERGESPKGRLPDQAHGGVGKSAHVYPGLWESAPEGGIRFFWPVLIPSWSAREIICKVPRAVTVIQPIVRQQDDVV